MRSLYDTILKNLPGDQKVEELIQGKYWTMAKLGSGCSGIAMTTEGDSIPPHLGEFSEIPQKEAAAAIESWNFPEASSAMAVINACYNTMDRLRSLNCYEPFENYCTKGLDLTGKTVGLIGHLGMPKDTLHLVRDVFILEKSPQPGDYPDSACEYLLPKCDVVLITGSSLINKTLPRLLELSRKAYTIVTGPTVPMCPELLNHNIQRLAGMVVSDESGMKLHTEKNLSGPPYSYGTTFLLKE